MIALLSAWPGYCPKCGERKTNSSCNQTDFFAGAAMTCDCGFHYGYAERDTLIFLHDDLAKYDERGEVPE